MNGLQVTEIVRSTVEFRDDMINVDLRRYLFRQPLAAKRAESLLV